MKKISFEEFQKNYADLKDKVIKYYISGKPFQVREPYFSPIRQCVEVLTDLLVFLDKEILPRFEEFSVIKCDYFQDSPGVLEKLFKKFGVVVDENVP